MRNTNSSLLAAAAMAFALSQAPDIKPPQQRSKPGPVVRTKSRSSHKVNARKAAKKGGK